MVGAGDEYTIGDTGGFVDTVIVEHSHSASVSSFTGTHTHGIGINSSSGSDNSSFVGTDDSLFSGGMSSGAAGNHTHTVNNLAFGNAGESGTGKNIPPYRALFYIIKEAN